MTPAALYRIVHDALQLQEKRFYGVPAIRAEIQAVIERTAEEMKRAGMTAKPDEVVNILGMGRG